MAASDLLIGYVIAQVAVGAVLFAIAAYYPVSMFLGELRSLWRMRKSRHR